MTFSILVGLLMAAILAVFFYRTTKMDVVAAILAALVSVGILGLLVATTIFMGQLFG